MSFYRGDNEYLLPAEEVGSFDTLGRQSNMATVGGGGGNRIYEGRFDRGTASEPIASPYGSGLPSAGLVAALFGIPAVSSLVGERLNRWADNTERFVNEWATTVGTTTGSGGTTTGNGETGPASSTPPPGSYPGPPPSSVIIYQPAGLQQGRRRSAPASLLPRAQALPRSRATRASPRLSAKQRKILLQEALVQALL